MFFWFWFSYLFICYTFFSLSFYLLYIFYIVLFFLFGLVVVRIVCGSFFGNFLYHHRTNPGSEFKSVVILNLLWLKHKTQTCCRFIWRIVFKHSWYKFTIWFWEEEQDWKLTWFRIRDEYSSLNWSSVWENCEISVSNQQYNAEQ